MPPKIKVVVDSNVFIASALNKGYCYDWIFGAADPQATYMLYTSESILAETSRKLSEKFNFDRNHTVQYLNALDNVVNKVRPRVQLNVVRDPADNMIIECAIEAAAELIITFDKDLLKLKKYENIKIAHPSMTKYWFQHNQN